jgi:hypothetical protein
MGQWGGEEDAVDALHLLKASDKQSCPFLPVIVHLQAFNVISL